VGLASNTHAAGLRSAPPRLLYVAYAQLEGDLPATLSVRSRAPAGEVAAAVRQTLQAHLPAVPINVRPLAAQVNATIVQDRMLAVLASAFGLLALTLACVGLYGLLAYGVAQRTKEIGIRLALGAQPARVVGSVLTRGGRLVLIGIAIGLPAAWAASRWIASMLFDTTPTEPTVLAGAIVLLVAAAQVAAYLPARRAARVDPLLALKQQ
jgi:ABC-type antimicrobial peptide transport system permease subunit